jgi:hypothetical protein
LCIVARKVFGSKGFFELATRIFLKKCQGGFDGMKGGLILLHTSCNVNVS